ncbi:hypothetical protein Dimus_010889 [Dionaea muscipula]
MDRRCCYLPELGYKLAVLWLLMVNCYCCNNCCWAALWNATCLLIGGCTWCKCGLQMTAATALDLLIEIGGPPLHFMPLNIGEADSRFALLSYFANY